MRVVHNINPLTLVTMWLFKLRFANHPDSAFTLRGWNVEYKQLADCIHSQLFRVLRGVW